MSLLINIHADVIVIPYSINPLKDEKASNMQTISLLPSASVSQYGPHPPLPLSQCDPNQQSACRTIPIEINLAS